jgi:hypothetical protein
MVDFHDRRDAIGSGDFNNPRGTFSLTTHGDVEASVWAVRDASRPNRKDVHDYYRGQKDTATWHEANRLAQRRAAHQGRVDGFETLADYADAYQGHLVRVMSGKGPDLADERGELVHRQAGYGRT